MAEWLVFVCGRSVVQIPEKPILTVLYTACHRFNIYASSGYCLFWRDMVVMLQPDPFWGMGARSPVPALSRKLGRNGGTNAPSVQTSGHLRHPTQRCRLELPHNNHKQRWIGGLNINNHWERMQMSRQPNNIGTIIPGQNSTVSYT